MPIAHLRCIATMYYRSRSGLESPWLHDLYHRMDDRIVQRPYFPVRLVRLELM